MILTSEQLAKHLFTVLYTIHNTLEYVDQCIPPHDSSPVGLLNLDQVPRALGSMGTPPDKSNHTLSPSCVCLVTIKRAPIEQ